MRFRARLLSMAAVAKALQVVDVIEVTTKAHWLNVIYHLREPATVIAQRIVFDERVAQLAPLVLPVALVLWPHALVLLLAWVGRLFAWNAWH